MINIWEECARIQTINQKLAGQVSIIIKKDWLSYLEIQEICQEIHRGPKEDTNTITDSPNTKKTKMLKLK